MPLHDVLLGFDDPLGLTRIVRPFLPQNIRNIIDVGGGSVRLRPQDFIPTQVTPRVKVPKGQEVGFFSSFLSIIGRVATTVLGIAAPVARAAAPAASRVAATTARVAATGARIAAPAAAAGAAFAVGQSLLTPSVSAPMAPAAGGPMAVTGGNGQTTRMTQIATIDNATGVVLRVETLKGAPFLMRSDVLIARRVFKLSSKLAGRMPRKTVKQSLPSQLTERIQRQLLENVGAGACPPACPPKC